MNDPRGRRPQRMPAACIVRTRALMTAGSVLAALSLVGWATMRSVIVFYLLAVPLGLAMSAVLYEPTFAHRGLTVTEVAA